MCLCAILPLAILWYRSDQTADDVIYARHGLLIDAISVRGNLWIETAIHWPDDAGLVHFDMSNPRDFRWPGNELNFLPYFGTYYLDFVMEQYWSYDPPWHIGVEFSSGVNSDALGVGRRTRPIIAAYPGIGVTIAYPYLIILCLMLGAWCFCLPAIQSTWRELRKKRLAKIS